MSAATDACMLFAVNADPFFCGGVSPFIKICSLLCRCLPLPGLQPRKERRARDDEKDAKRVFSSVVILQIEVRWTTLTRARIEKRRNTSRAKSNHLAATASSSSSSSSSSDGRRNRQSRRNKSATSSRFGDARVHRTMGESSSEWMSSSLSSSREDSRWGQKRTKIVPRNSNRLDGKGGGGGVLKARAET